MKHTTHIIGQIKDTAVTCKYFYYDFWVNNSAACHGDVDTVAHRENRGYLPLLLACITVNFCTPFINIIMPGYVIDELMGNQDVGRLVLYVLLIIAGNFLLTTLARGLNETRIKMEDWFAKVLDMRIGNKAMTMQFSDTESSEAIEAEKKAEIGLSWYSGGIRGLSDCVTTILSALLTLFGVTWLLTTVSPWLILTSVITVALSAFATSKMNQAQQEVFEKTPAINRFYSYIYQQISLRKYAKELRLFEAEELVEKKAMDNAAALNKMDNECAIKQLKWSSLGTISSAVNYGIACVWLGRMAINGEISIGEFVVSITALETFTNQCLITIINNIQGLFMKCNFMKAFITFMDFAEDRQQGSLPVTDKNRCEIEFRHVFFKYPGTDNYILKDINLTIKNGERLSIVGLNGAGKTTLVKLLCRLYDVEQGEILVNGINIKDYRTEEYLELLSVVFQDFKLFSYSLNKNIQISDVGGEKKSDIESSGDLKESFDTNSIKNSEALKEVCQKNSTKNNEFLKKVYQKNSTKNNEILEEVYQKSGIKDWVHSLEKKGDTLLYKDYDDTGVEPSGGQAQKIALARAIYRNTPLVILDEPTAALDPVAEYEIYSKFNELVSHKTAIYISHRLSSCRFCDKIAVFDQKTIKEYGTHDELTARNGLYAKMFRTQAKWYVEE